TGQASGTMQDSDYPLGSAPTTAPSNRHSMSVGRLAIPLGAAHCKGRSAMNKLNPSSSHLHAVKQVDQRQKTSAANLKPEMET
ncbi:hypothetical protein CN437_28225, partial [Bacillus cereus]